MTDNFLAHVRFSDHIARCADCTLFRGEGLAAICPTGRVLLDEWQKAEQLATAQAEEYDEACAADAEFAREAVREAFE